jgi:hypothetical protein
MENQTKISNYWFYLEPFTHLEIKNAKYLLYNSLNYSYIYGDSPRISEMLNQLIINNYVIQINDSLLNENERGQLLMK